MDPPDVATGASAAALDTTMIRPSTPNSSLRPKVRRRASSLLGADIPVITTAPAVSTMQESPAGKAASRQRRRALSKSREAGRSIPEPKNWFTWYREVSYRHTWVNPLLVCVLVVLCYLPNPTPSNPVHDCLFVAYRQSELSPNGTVLYGKGLRDLKFVTFYTFFFSFTREFVMQRLLQPIARRALPLATRRSKAKNARFMEQSYTALYYLIFGPFGVYVMWETPGLWYFNSVAFWESHPQKLHSAPFKAFYLLQWAFWAQQAIVLCLQLEKPRKDFKELVWHHVVTLTLIIASYRFHYGYPGIAVFVTHDISDFFLATSKILNYMDSVLIGPYFVIFIGSWVYLRHYCNLIILWSVLTEYRTVGIWELNWETGVYKCTLAQVIITFLLGSLQAVNLFWLFLILRIAYRIVRTWGEEYVDERSDDEDDEEISDDDSNNDESNKLLKEKLNDLDDITPTIMLNGEAVNDSNDKIPLPLLNGNGSVRKRDVPVVVGAAGDEL